MLTPLEEAQFTHLNCVAYDQYRKTASEKGQIPCCWLTMSDEAREAARQDILVTMSRMMGMATRITVGNFDSVMSPAMTNTLAVMTGRWRGMEETAKRMRDEGNPRAFFMG